MVIKMRMVDKDGDDSELQHKDTEILSCGKLAVLMISTSCMRKVILISDSCMQSPTDTSCTGEDIGGSDSLPDKVDLGIG